MLSTRLSSRAGFLVWGLVLCATLASSQEPAPPVGGGADGTDPGAALAPRMRLRLEDAVRLATLNNAELKVAYYGHLIARTQIAEAEAAFDPAAFVNVDGGVQESAFLFLLPVGPPDPITGDPTNVETLIRNSTTLFNWTTGLRGKLITGATWELQTTTAFRDTLADSSINPSYAATTTASFTQPILQNAWMQFNGAGIQQAKNSEAISRLQYRGDLLGKILETHQAYWNFVFSIRDLEVKKNSLELAEKLLEINRVKVRTGVFAPIEIASAEAGVAQRETDVIVAENAILDRQDALLRLIMPFQTNDEWDIALEPIEDQEQQFVQLPPLKECVEIALAEVPSLKERRLELRNLAIDLAVADNLNLPKLDLTGSVSWTATTGRYADSYHDAFGNRGAETWNVGVSFEVPLGRRAGRARLARARLQRDQAIMNYRSAQLSVVEAVRTAYRGVVTAERAIASTTKAAQLKQQELKNEEVKLENRVSTNFQVLQVEDDLAQRRTEVISARVNYHISLASLANAMGTSLEVLNWPMKRK